jgi:hypothetical protein
MANFFQRKGYILLELFFIFLISLIPLIWFIPNHMVIGLDSGYPIDFISYFDQRTYTWLGSQVFGFDTTLWLGQIFLIALPTFIYSLGIGMYDVQKITFVFWYFVMSVSIYALVLYLFKKPSFIFVRFCAVLFYMINFFLFSFSLQGEQTIFSAYALLPLSILLLIMFYEKKSGIFKTSILCNLAFFFLNAGGILGIPLLGAAIVGCLVVILYFFILAFKKQKARAFFLRTLCLFFVSAIVFCLVNAYWLYPFVNLFSQHYSNQVAVAGGIESAISWTKFISEYTSFANLIRLQGDLNWYSHADFYSNFHLSNPFLIIASFIFPIFSFCAYWLVKSKQEKKIILLFLCIALFGFLFSSGTHAPFGFIYSFLMENLPGFAAFRSAYYKFAPLIYLSFAILFAVSTFYVVSKVQSGVIRKSLKFIIIIILILYHFPIFNKENFVFEKPFSTMLTIPNYVLDYGEFEKERRDYYRTLVLPPLNNYPMTTLSWNYYGPSIFSGLSDKPFVQNLNGILTQQELFLVNSVYQSIRENNLEQFFKLADFLDIHAIIITKDVVLDYQKIPIENPDKYQKLLEDSRLFYVVWEKGPWIVYAWEKPIKSNKIFATNNIASYDNFFSNNTAPAIMNFDSFVFSEQVAEIKNEIPITSSINYFSCISCMISDESLDRDIVLPSSRVNPTSFLYPLKRFWEGKRNQGGTLSQNVDMYVGLSLKRLAEVKSLGLFISEGKKFSNIDVNSWEEDVDTLFFYWNKIFNLIKELKSEGDYDTLFHIYKYANFEQKELLSVYTQLSSKNLRSIPEIVENCLWIIDNVKNELSDFFDKDNLGRKFIFSTNTTLPVYVDASSFSSDQNGDKISQYLYGDDPSLRNKEASNSPTLINTSLQLVTTISYPDILNKLELKERAVLTPDKSYNCLSSQIKHFVWNNKYIISADYPSANEDRRVFIKMDKYIMPEGKGRIGNYLKPDQNIQISKNSGRFIKLLTGENNDVGAEILFCSESGDPDMLFSNMKAIEYKEPVLFSMEKEVNNLKNPIISFKRINPVEYIVSVQNAENSYTLGFLEKFSPQWKATFIDNSLPVSQEKYHFTINGYANAWKIDRGGNYSIRIKFESQDLFNKGIVISILGVTVISIYCLFLLKKIWKKN